MITQEDLLYALENGILDPSHLQGQIQMYKKKEILNKHPYEIYFSSDGRWATYVPDKDKKRRLVKRKRRDDLIDYICKFYTGSENVYTFKEVYKMWREYRDQVLSAISIDKYNSDYKRYFEGEDFEDLEVSNITRIDVETFMSLKIKSLKLCKSAAKSLYHYIDNTICFAREKSITSNYPTEFLSAKMFYKDCTPSLRSLKPKVMNEETREIFFEKIDSDIAKDPSYIALYAIKFAALTGMRVGEIAALKWEDVKENYILVCRSQKWDSKSGKYYIDDTKNRIQRHFPLTFSIKNLLLRVKMVEIVSDCLTEFIFSGKDGPLNFRIISSCMKNKCRQLGIETMGIHVFRRTINSTMAHDGVPAIIRADILGHSKEVNEQYYTFDVSSMEEKTEIIDRINKGVFKSVSRNEAE